MDIFNLKFNALFFPDTQQAVLETEQKRLRMLHSRTEPSPFCIFPPCIPLFPSARTDEREDPCGAGASTPTENGANPTARHALEALPLQTENGWIVRKLRAPPPPRAGSSDDRFPPRGFPLPEFPRDACVILGFAGENAARLLNDYLNDRKDRHSGGEPSRAPTCGEIIRSEVWYTAEVAVEIKSGGSFFSAAWHRGAPHWKGRTKTPAADGGRTGGGT